MYSMYSDDFFAAVQEEKRKVLERLEKLDAILGDRALIQQKTPAPKGKRSLSPEARERIAKAQRERWAKVRKGAKKLTAQ